MSWSAGLVVLLLAGGLLYLALAAFVWSRREVEGSRPLVVILLAIMVWATCYPLELASRDVEIAKLWAGLKYIGIVNLAPALWAFVLRYTGRGGLPRRLLALMLIEPVLVLGLLAIPATHDLIHYYPADPRDLRYVLGSPYPENGALFWPMAVYQYVLMMGAILALVVQLARLAQPYRRQGAVMMAASILPFLGNLFWNLGLFGRDAPDPTPFLFVVGAVVLVWGFFQLRLLDLLPVARGVVIEQMADGVLVIDVYGRVVDANPAGAALMGVSRSGLVGRRLTDLLPRFGETVGRSGTVTAELPGTSGAGPGGAPREGERREVAVTVTGVTDPAGRKTAQLVVLRDITDLKRAEHKLQELLWEQTRLSQTLTQSLRPASLPQVPGISLAARSVPAARGGGLSGDFYDVHPAGRGRSAFVLGDVSGKGVHAAVVTSMARYTVRTLSAQGMSPAGVLQQLNAALAAPTDDDERFCTVVYGQLAPWPGADDGFRLTLALGGHPPPLLRRNDSTVDPVGDHGTVLGLLPVIDVHEVDIHLHPGDLLLAYTDGVTEARRGNEQFGEDRLAEVLSRLSGSVDDVADGVLSAVEAFASDREDVALLVLAVA